MFGGDSSNKNDEDLSNDEAKQFQSMIYNLMVRLTGWEHYVLQFNFPMAIYDYFTEQPMIHLCFKILIFVLCVCFQFGNVEAYEDIDNQRKTERSYHFALNDMEDTVAEESSEPEEELELEQE